MERNMKEFFVERTSYTQSVTHKLSAGKNLNNNWSYCLTFTHSFNASEVYQLLQYTETCTNNNDSER